MTIRSEGQFNTVVYEDEDIYRGQDRRDVILMNAEDLRRRGLEPDQMVCVRSAVGVMHGVRARPHDIKAGNAAMYYPEANVLVPRTTDPDSKTPAFKCVLIALEPEPAGSGSLRQPREEAGSGRAPSNLVR
jgi:anaerobic selenocysteine-containing dehydrogenase